MRAKVNLSKEYRDIKDIVNKGSLNTVCQEAGCPNIFECWQDKEATFLIGGDACTRRCDFCQIESAKPTEYDTDEPVRVAESVLAMGLKYATITGVCRDDRDDLGVWLYAETIKQIHERVPGVGVEMLAPDFNGKPELLQQIFDQRPAVFAHNVETVPRIFRRIRPGFRYERSLDVLTQSRDAGLITKSNLILGMGETNEEVTEALEQLYAAGCQLITITQYLRPNVRLLPVDRWVTPAEFDDFAAQAKAMGYLGVMSGPLVRSSYKAGSLYREATEQLGQKVEASRG
ncbi:Pyrin [Platysternon megacephalum]|uniref:Lipoyl synthase, mitochondrial n=1 Tax=Platysternon megacephalum TaxID=55544 RepID=A0A4D9DC40_9SAUR|nr:Pyrin [Platysternon megacephalum]